MSTSPTESTASSQSTVHPSESTVSSETTDFSDPLLEKVFLAGCRKNFVGQGPRQFSKAEIKELDIPDVVDFVAGKVEHSQVKKSITYYLGLCRVYQKAVNYFEEDVVKLHDELNSALYNNDDNVPSTPKKAQKPKKKKDDQQDKGIEAASIHTLELVDHNYIALLDRNLGTDKHLMNEMDDRLHAPAMETLGVFGDESHLRNDFRNDRTYPLGSPPLIPEGLPDNTDVQNILDGFEAAGGTAGISSGTVLVVQAMVHQSGGTEAGRTSSPRREVGRDATGDGSVKGTPKRKPGSPYDETPSKRQRRKSPSESSGGKSVSRKLFGPDAPSSPMPADEVMRRNVDQEGAGTFDELVPPPPPHQEGAGRSSFQIEVDPGTIQDTEGDHESEQPPAADVPSQASQRLPEASPVNSIDMELEELPDETVAALTPKRRKRIRPRVDEKKQIPRVDITNIDEYVHVHTKSAQSTLINLEKLLLKNLLSMPSTKLKANGPCTWPKKLQHLYTENAHPILHPNHERTLANQTPRDVNVDKRPRLSTFGPHARSEPTDPSIPQDENITPADIEENPADPDRELMPPPSEPPMLFRPSDEQATPRTPGRSRGERSKTPSPASSPQQQLPRTPGRNGPSDASSPQQRPPGTPGRDSQPNLSAVSPRQRRQIPRILETEPAAEAGQSDEAQLPVQMSPTPSARERSTLMDARAFYKFLKDTWVARSNKVELDHLIPPQRSTLTKFYRYFTYLQSFQGKKILKMIQKKAYGPVRILQTIAEEDEQCEK